MEIGSRFHPALEADRLYESLSVLKRIERKEVLNDRLARKTIPLRFRAWDERTENSEKENPGLESIFLKPPILQHFPIYLIV